MKHSKMKKAMGLKGFMNSVSKPKMQMGDKYTSKDSSDYVRLSKEKKKYVDDAWNYSGSIKGPEKRKFPDSPARAKYNETSKKILANPYFQQKVAPLNKPSMKKGGSFPDLNKDGQITKADILMGRGVIGKKKAQAGMKTPPKYTAADSARYEETGKRFDKLSRDYMRSPWQITNSPQGDYKLYPGAREDILKKVDSMTSNPYFINKIKPEYERQKNAKPKGQKGMNVMKEAKKNATRTITDGYKGTGAPNPLAAIVKNTAKKSKMGMKPKMQIGGAFNKGVPAAIATEGKDFMNKESFKKGGMSKKKKK